MNHYWNTKDDEILIQFVKRHEALYNTKCPDYKDTYLKYKLWCEIGATLNRYEIDCSKRWCYVRDYYVRRKTKRGACGEAAKKRFELLSFLDKHSKSNSSANSDDGSTDNKNETIENDNSEGVKSQNEDSNDTDEEQKYEENENQDGEYSDKVDEDPLSVRKRKISDIHRHIPNIEHKITAQNELDENDLFFSSMAKIVKKLPTYEQAKLRMEIGSLVGTAELRCIEIESTEDIKSEQLYHED